MVVAGGNLLVPKLDGSQNANIGEPADGALSADSGASSPGSLVASGAH